jgi:CheY-like chemotaxis protein
MPEDREICRAAGMDDYIAKPIEITRLVETVQRWGQRVNSSEPAPRDGTSG